MRHFSFPLLEQVSLGKKVRPPKGSIEWLHIPKTGTSFGNVLILWACPELPKQEWFDLIRLNPDVPQTCLNRFHHHPGARQELYIGDHYSLENRTEEQLQNVFTMIRSPGRRLASGYHYLGSVRMLKDYDFNASYDKLCNSVSKQDVAHAAIGAQVRIILGHNMSVGAGPRFHPMHNLTAEDVEMACSRLSKFAFVGVTDFWRTTVCVFNDMFGVRWHPVEEVTLRKRLSKPPTNYAECGDHADKQLFHCAMRHLITNIKKRPRCGNIFLEELTTAEANLI